MKPMRPEEWKPAGIEDLEPAAWRALREECNSCVVAGPGAGKTEFLAQRAAYLLQTGTCSSPRRILAISFKRDAKRNLADRVGERCSPDQAARFDSLTYDGFAKSLIDRFLPAIPIYWRPDRHYQIVMPSAQDYRAFLDGIQYDDGPREWMAEARAILPKSFEKNYLARLSLSNGEPTPRSAKAWTVYHWWEKSLRETKPSALSFVMIVRLAELLLRSNEKICNALRLTYPFVFLDEFQDTTYAQYSLVRTAFMGSKSVLTSVGDDKQRIMVWAGARSDAFERFKEEFEAKRIPLLANYRSTKELVQIQHVVARAIEPTALLPEAHTKAEITGDVAEIWRFPSQAAEANGIAKKIASDMQAHNLGPRDFALLVRQKADAYESDLESAFASRGLRIRNENRLVGKITIQDVLAEDLTEILLPFLRLGATHRARRAWTACVDNLIWLWGYDPDDDRETRRLTNELERFAQRMREVMIGAVPSKETAANILSETITFIGADHIRQAVREYMQGERFNDVRESICAFLQEGTADADNWNAALDVIEGIDQVPLMTVHKSKGLEFHTTIFVGLDDEAWWSFSKGDLEGLSTFFVALSRARQRAFFCYCPYRGGRQKIRKLYELLNEAEVPEYSFENE